MGVTQFSHTCNSTAGSLTTGDLLLVSSHHTVEIGISGTTIGGNGYAGACMY